MQLFQLWRYCLCEACRHPRFHFGKELGQESSRRSRPPSSTVDIKDPLELRSVYGHPFDHPYGPFRHRLNPNYKPNSYTPVSAVVEFELSRLAGSIRRVTWVYPGLLGEYLTIDERNRVRAYRLDHPDATLKFNHARCSTRARG